MEKVSKENKEKIMELIKKAGNSKEYEISWDEKGIPKIKKKTEIKKGKRSRASGARFEARVRQGLEKLGWIVDKWTNTVDYDKEEGTGKIVPAKRKFNPFSKVMTIGTGFPDFICIKKNESEGYDVIGLEVKTNGYLDKVEKGMCIWLLQNKIFSKILIAKKGDKRGEIEYIDFRKKHMKD